MPFTISHVAAVLPFSRYLARIRVLSAVVIGSMVPDFGWLLPWQPDRFETHSIVGLYAFCLPVGLASWWLFQRLIKPAVMELLPDGAYVRSSTGPLNLGSPLQWLYAAIGVFIGAVTHLVWDGFTHEGARGVRMIPALDDDVVDIAGHQLAGFKFLQLGSSVAGLLLVLWLAVRALRAGSTIPAPQRLLDSERRRQWTNRYWGTAVASAAVFFVLQHRAEWAYYHHVRALPNAVAIAGRRGLAFALVAVSAWFAIRVKGTA